MPPASGFTVWFDYNNSEHFEDDQASFEVKGGLLMVTVGRSITYYPAHSWLKVEDHRA